MNIENRINLDPLNAFVKALSGKKAVRVGIFGNKKNSRENSKSATNAELGAIHEFGSFSRGIPARSFLRMPISFRAKKIIQNTVNDSKHLVEKGDVKGILGMLGKECEKAVLEAFDTRGFGNWKPDAPSTIKAKKSSSPLIDTGQLQRSISSKVVDV